MCIRDRAHTHTHTLRSYKVILIVPPAAKHHKERDGGGRQVAVTAEMINDSSDISFGENYCCQERR